jgi:rubrerythrin
MYPAFIYKALEEGNTKAVHVFTRAKLAESVHAERYLAAYKDLDASNNETFYLCHICGYIHKGEDFEQCPICFRLKDSFTAY